MRSIIFAIILGFGLAGCSSAPVKVEEKKSEPVNYLEKSKADTENCIIKMLRAGFRQGLIYPMCRDIYKESNEVQGVTKGNAGQ